MKNLMTAILLISCLPKISACAYFDPDYEYFNLFAQQIITDKQYYPFLLTYGATFYESEKMAAELLDENTEAWIDYFDNKMTYSETDALLKIIRKKHLVNWKNGKLTHVLSKKLGANFYKQYREAFDYLIIAKSLEPYMKIAKEDTDEEYWYFGGNEFAENKKNILELDYETTLNQLRRAYKNAQNKKIKQRYAFQIVRYLHYTRHFRQAVDAFYKYAYPLRNDSPIYYYTLDQKAGAERGLGNKKQANYDFFQVFIHSRNRKKGAYVSMRLGYQNEFDSLLEMAKNKEEQNMAYFLLAYSGFNNSIPLMEKMYANQADSEILKVLAVRTINQLEREQLPSFSFCSHQECKRLEDRRLPKTSAHNYYSEGDKLRYEKFMNSFQVLITKIAREQQDEFWKMAEAYLFILDKKYDQAQTVLAQIKKPRKAYAHQLEELKMLCEILKPETITAEFENTLMTKYSDFFQTPQKVFWYDADRNTAQYVKDVLANRYMLQNQKGKSFLINNMLSSLDFAPNLELAKQLYSFYHKKDKTLLEKYMAKSLDDVGDIEAYFNRVFGDFAMKSAEFEKAQNYYQKVQNTSGLTRYEWRWDEKAEKNYLDLQKYKTDEYNGFDNIPNYVLGYNVWESYGSEKEISMRLQYLSEFPFIKPKMNKYELAMVASKLQEIGKQKGEKAAKANQLLGNLMYNTSKLGYYRELFVGDIDNSNGGKYHFTTKNEVNAIYYKFYDTTKYFYLPDAFDLAIDYYQLALQNTADDEQKARILFQMASAEQGNYYQWEAENTQDFWSQNLSYDERDAKQKQQEIELNQVKNQEYRKAFARLKNDYMHTQTAQELRKSCLYFEYYTR